MDSHLVMGLETHLETLMVMHSETPKGMLKETLKVILKDSRWQTQMEMLKVIQKVRQMDSHLVTHLH